MIKFKNINGDVFLAVGSIKRKSALNGEKSLTGTLFEGDDVLNKIDKGWSLEFDNEPYVVTYFERNDNDNTVEFDAIHKFFWDMNKDVLYFSWSGSHTAKAYLEQIFKDTGYQYALNFEPSAFEKENWGMKNKLSLFNDVIDSMGGEFEINGTLVSIFKNIGSDLSTIVRHGFNLSDMSLENDNTDFVTYGEGFGAYADQENQTGERLHVTYTSPLAKTFGKLHAEPIDDQRYTIKDNLLQVIKDKVDGSFAISIKLSLYDLKAAGYPYKMANVGDWLLAIDENLDFKQKIRIISVDDEFATDDTRISYTVTCGDVGVVQKYQQANASIGQKVDSAYQNAQDAKESSIQAVIAANGKNTNYYVNGIDNLPATANEGDIAFVQTGDGQAMYIWTKMPDGSFKWVKRLDPDTGEQIAAGVDDAIKQAKSQAAQMDEVRASEAAVFQSEANKALSSAAAERVAFSSNATSMANSASAHADTVANSASAYAKAQAASALSSANSELAKAKQELGSEVSKAQSDIVATNKELSGKVSQTDFDTVTGDLTTKYGQVKATADAVTADVAKYETANDKKVSANTASINALNNQITSKVSQTDFDKTTGDLSGKYSVQQQTINGISQTVTELQAKANAQGQVNLLVNSEFNPDLEGWYTTTTGTIKEPYRSYWQPDTQATTVGWGTQSGSVSSYARLRQDVQLSSTPGSGHQISMSWYSYTSQTDFYNNLWVTFYDKDNKSVGNKFYKWATTDGTNPSKQNSWNVQNKWEGIDVPDTAVMVNVSFEAREGTSAYLAHPMLVMGATIGDYVPGNYNNNARVAALELGIDHITGLVMDPKNGLSATAALAANGMTVATKAQSDATTAIQTAKGVQTTVESMGQVNHLNNSEFDPDLEGWDTSSVGKAPYRSYFDQTVNKVTVGFNTMNDNVAVSILAQTVTLASTPGARGYVSLSWQSYTNPSTTGKQTVSLGFYDSSNKIIGTAKQADWSDTSGKWPVQKIEGLAIPDGARTLQVMFYASEKVTAYLAKPMLAFEKTIGTYTPSNYNNNATVESIHTQLADQITDEIQDRTTGDKNTLQQSQNYTISQIKSATEGYESSISQSADAIMASVSQVNRLFNTQFTPDLQGWNVANNGAGGFNSNFYRSYLRNGETVVGVNTVNVNVDGNTTKYYAYLEQDVALPGNNGGTVVSISWDATTNTMNNYANLWIQFKNADGSTISSVNKRWDTPVGKGWQTQKWENVSVPTNAHHIRVSFQTREGTNAYLSRPMLTFTNTAMSYMPGGYHNTDTILQLFKDNWAIGIQDNSGKLISGINGDTSNTRIVGKQITLDGNVTVTGDFYAKGGNFKNLNASNITTGTINAAKINVINLDVSSLSGNITNFVKSYWDGAYGEEVSIQSDRITFYTNLYRSNTTISEGQINMMVYNNYTKTSENIGGIRHTILPGAENQDYLNFYLDGWSNVGNNGSNAAAHGGDGIVFSVSDGSNNGNNGAIGTLLLEWDNELLANSQGQEKGWHFWDFTKVHDDFLVTPDGAYQGLLVSSANYNNTTYPAIMGNQKKDDGPGILMGSTEMYFMYKGDAYPLSLILKSAGWNL
ncbi:phage tail protein [Weissella paramesenteroides]|uniref:phage tail protein n=3 Tax=Weissella paramesenteroides TaxID=1249 RepID=UPI0039830A08